MYNLIVKNFEDDIEYYSKNQIIYLLKYLHDFHSWNYITFDELKKNNIDSILIRKYGSLPNYIIQNGASMDVVDYKINSSVKILVIYDDIHHSSRIRRERIKGFKKCDSILLSYGYAKNLFYKEATLTNIFLPHSAAYNINFNNNTTIKKILISGHIGDQYPKRKKMLELMDKYPNKIEYFKPNANYRDKNNLDTSEQVKVMGKKYYELLSNYFCCFTCDANHTRPYIVAKHFEIMASGSLLLSCNDETKDCFEELGYIDGVHYISANVNNLEDKVLWISNPDNFNIINKIRKNGYDFTTKYHMYKNRAEFINDYTINQEHYISLQKHSTKFNTDYIIAMSLKDLDLINGEDFLDEPISDEHIID